MGTTVTLLILTICIIFRIEIVNSEKMQIENIPGPPKIVSNSQPVPSAGYIIQEITPMIHYVGQMFYFQRNTELIFPNKKINGTIYVWLQNNGSTMKHYFKELSRETVNLITPTKEYSNQFIIGSNRNLRLCTKNNTDYSLSEPIIHFDDPGYIIHSAHCNKQGTMLILLIGTTNETAHLGKLYKIENKTAKLVTNLFTGPRDFRFNRDNTAIYMIHDHGKRIAELKYDMKTGDMGNATKIFDMDEYPKFHNHFMESVVADRSSGDLWVTVKGKQGYVLKIDPTKKALISVTSLPTKDLTFITFGHNDYKTLFVGSKRTCVKGHSDGAIYGISGMGVRGEADKPIKW